jgi:hypothetical protein
VLGGWGGGGGGGNLVSDTEEEHGPRVFENRVRRKIFGLNRDEVTGVEKTTQRGAS